MGFEAGPRSPRGRRRVLQRGGSSGGEKFVTVERLQRPLCGGSRPHFFRGVCTVVTKLFHICEPDVAVFGRKVYQQWRVICRMVRDLETSPWRWWGCPSICREPDGLAMSSRNARLSPESRERALCISRGLAWAEKALLHAHHPSTTTSPISDLTSQPVLLAVAAHFPARDRGTVRLIDNTVLNDPGDSKQLQDRTQQQ
ncbi:hypothetical protein VOLCADRAFT_86503 [Volvox carteri f. nagariensis]|uniref:Pantoate--beta-alanine ligase n=1 Tax=Volvox carteri f. nagariensis TaxID=3068 RepID=D8TGW2_VOLCA|nr:uncharacterized protein VOLCADRAFT_86503 [Volvox carteri f. nagariensis]EFJ52969.1 hypothetical protein VOLCADRAFT_86503 [Volvox carteri f. nagariensis]|eukprot:XP_002945974.1 hypothetical protein VOLCADRAFT_86503 [Volvox carteri f. nagariensis]